MFKVTSFPKSTGLRYIAQTAKKRNPAESFKIDKDINGITVISIQPKVNTLSKLAAVFNAGSRYEDYHSRGLNHLLRRSVGLSSGDLSGINVTRHFQQMGAQLRCIGTRENLAYVVDFSYDLLDKVGELLSHTTTRQKFYQWELDRSAKPLIKTDIQYLRRRDFDTLCSEYLHKAAFRDNLGNSLFADEYRMSQWNIDIIEGFLNQTFSAKQSMLVGVSVKHENLVRLAEIFKIRPAKESKLGKSVFRGGEIRIEIPLEYTTASVAWAAPGSNDMKEGVACGILADAIDSGLNLRIKWNKGEFDLISKAVKDSAVVANCEANSVYTAYSDHGLLGFTVTGAPGAMRTAVQGLCDMFGSIGKNGVSPHDFEIAKKSFIVKLLMRSETNEGLLEHIISQSTRTGDILSIDQLIDIAKSVTIDDVNKAAKLILTNPKKAIAAIGDLSNFPYLDELH